MAKDYSVGIEQVMEVVFRPNPNDVFTAERSHSLGKILEDRVSIHREAINALYHSPWFRRIWCVQEIRLNDKAVAYWGQLELKWVQIQY
jgi:predicted acetyltransferase